MRIVSFARWTGRLPVDLDIDKVELTKDEIEEYLKRPSSFALDPRTPHYAEMFKTWAIGPIIETRESPIIDKSNAQVLLRELEAKGFAAEDDYNVVHTSHWAVGWADHLSFRVLDSDGTPSRVAKFIHGFFTYLKDDYPIADEDHYSNLQCEAEWEYYESQWDYLVRSDAIRDGVPTDAMEKVHEHLRDNGDPREDSDGIPYYTEDEIIEAARTLGFTSKEESDNA